MAAHLVWPLPNVILGVSAERQQEAYERIPDLLATPAAKRIVSAEPLLGPIDFRSLFHGETLTDALDGMSEHGVVDAGDRMVAVNPKYRTHAKLDGVIVGGESGKHARPMHPDWPRAIRDQCAAASVPYFFKQWGAWAPDKPLENAGVRGLLMRQDGSTPTNADAEKMAAGSFDYRGWQHVSLIGKRAAGRLLDGREHNDLPWSVRV